MLFQYDFTVMIKEFSQNVAYLLETFYKLVESFYQKPLKILVLLLVYHIDLIHPGDQI